MRNLVAGLVFVISAVAFAVARTPADEEVHATEAVVEPEVESACERYGQAADRIVEARFPKPKPRPLSHFMADDGGYTGVQAHYSGAPSRPLNWWCKGQHLTLEGRGVWVLDAGDIRITLERLLRDFRDQGLEPAEDGIEITLGTIYFDESVHFDPRAGATALEEDGEPTQERARPAWLTDYSLHMNIIGVLGSPSGSPPSEEAEPLEFYPFDALIDSLSPGVRASIEGADAERMAAREQEQMRRKAEQMRREAEHEQKEAEYAAFIEERLRRLNERNEEAHD